MNSRSSLAGYAAGLAASFFWGIHSVIIRYLTSQGISPYLIAGLRLYIGTAVLFLIVVIQRIAQSGKKSERQGVHFEFNNAFWLASLSLGVNFLFFQSGLAYTLASDANLIQNFSPVAVLVISTVFLSHRIKEIAPNKAFWSKLFQIVLIGSIGASLVLANESNIKLVAENSKLFGDFLEFIGMIFFSIFVIYSSEYSKTAQKTSSLFITMMMLAVACLPVTLFMPFSELTAINPFEWMLLAFIGVFSTGFAYLLWHIASKRLNVVPLTLNLIYIGIITVLSEYLFLNLALDWKFVLGAILMIFASIGAEIMNIKAKNHVPSVP